MSVLVSRLHYPVTVLGPGRRAGIWLQGCSIRCPGCISVDTWPPDTRSQVEVSDVMVWLDSLPPHAVDGVTISGGEPTDQPVGLAALLDGIRTWRAGRRPGLEEPDILVFTGRDPEWLDTPQASCLSGADAVVAGPFRVDLPGPSPLRGSENQRLVTLTSLGERRRIEYERSPRNRVQVEVTDESIWLIGIPPEGGLAAFQKATEAQGLTMKGRSWLR